MGVSNLRRPIILIVIGASDNESRGIAFRFRALGNESDDNGRGIQVAEVVIPGHSGERSEDNFIVLRALDGGIFVYGKRFPEVLTFSAYARGNLEYDDAVATLCDLNMMGSEEQ